MSRRKPRFTPDPPPYGASNEQILAWVNAQLQRIEDYWPRDDGDRITALEELQSRFSGEWSISGQSLIRFEGSVTQQPSNACNYSWSLGETITLAEANADRIYIANDPDYFMVGGVDLGQVDTYQLIGSTWTRVDTVTNSVSRFGSGFAVSEDDGVLVVGSPDTNSSPGSKVLVYTGSVSGGWALSQTISAPNNDDDLFGDEIALSDDGELLAVHERDTNTVYFYDRVSRGSYSYSSSLSAFPKSMDFSEDKSVLILGETGGSEQVRIFDNDGSNNWTLRQTISRTDYVGSITTGCGTLCRFGESVKLSPSKNWLAVCQNQGSPGSWVYIFQLNETTNLYEYCQIISAPGDAQGIDGLINETTQNLLTVNEDTVYRFVGA